MMSNRKYYTIATGGATAAGAKARIAVTLEERYGNLIWGFRQSQKINYVGGTIHRHFGLLIILFGRSALHAFPGFEDGDFNIGGPLERFFQNQGVCLDLIPRIEMDLHRLFCTDK